MRCVELAAATGKDTYSRGHSLPKIASDSSLPSSISFFTPVVVTAEQNVFLILLVRCYKPRNDKDG
jgi:hypothetical protein